MTQRFRIRVSIIEETGSTRYPSVFDRDRELHFERVEDAADVLRTDDPERLAEYIARDIAYELAGAFIRRRKMDNAA